MRGSTNIRRYALRVLRVARQQLRDLCIASDQSALPMIDRLRLRTGFVLPHVMTADFHDVASVFFESCTPVLATFFR